MDTSPHPITGVEPTTDIANAPDDCCPSPDHHIVEIENEGDRAVVRFECQSDSNWDGDAPCTYSAKEVHTIRHVERDDGERLEANQTSYGCCDEEAFQLIWRGKTSRKTVEFVGECQSCGTKFSDVYKYYSNETPRR